MDPSPDKNYNNECHCQACDRLLVAAEELFAEKGFAETSVRDITSLAGCNVAAVNYHFGGKEKLYEQVFLNHLTTLRKKRLDSIDQVIAREKDQLTLESLLRSFSRAFLAPLHSNDSTQRLMRLMIREHLDPRLPKELFVREMIQPVKTAMSEAILSIFTDMDPIQTQLCVFSLVGQLFHLVHSHEILELSKTEAGPFDMDTLIEHIIRFTSAGIRGIANNA